MSISEMPLDHSGMAMMSIAECLHQLGSARIGRIAFLSDGYPTILPVNHGMDGDAVVFRTNVGTKLGAAGDELPVAFEVDAIDADRRMGWSVVMRGTAREVDDPAQIAKFKALRLWPFADSVERDHWIRITPYEITGRSIVHSYEH